MKHKLKKFASFLLTGKAATLPFFANSSLAQETALTTTPTAQEALQNATVVSMVLTNLRDGDEVYIAASDDKDALEYLKIDQQFRLGTSNFQILSQFQFDSTDSAYHAQANGDGSYTVSVPVDLNQAASPEFYLQAVIVKPDGNWAFSELEQVTLNRTVRREVRGECSDPYGTPPVAAFTFSPGTVLAPVSLDATQSSDPNGSIVEYTWAVNGQALSGVTSQTSFATPGDYPIRLTVTDNEGCTDTLEQTVTVIPPSPTCVGDDEACIEYQGNRTKQWGDSLELRYQFKGFNPGSRYDVYVGIAMPNNGELLFLQPSVPKQWFVPPIFVPYKEQPIAYLSQDYVPDQKGSLLTINYIPDGMPEGTYTFYVAVVLPGKNPFNFLDHIFLSQTEISLAKRR